MKRWMRVAMIASLMLASLGLTAGNSALAREEVLPLPPIPPDTLVASEAAPLPNSGMRAPLDLREASGPQLTPTLIGPKYTYQGEAFLRGSTVQTEQNRNVNPVAGFNLKMPLQ